MNWKSSAGTCSKNALCSLCGNGHRTGVGCWLVYQFLQPPTQTVPGKAVPSPGLRIMHGPDAPQFQALRIKMETEWIPQMMEVLDIERAVAQAGETDHCEER